MEKVIQKQLKSGRQEVLDAALGHLHKSEFHEYDILLQMIEALSESSTLEHGGVRYDVFLVAAPVLAWTQFSIPYGVIDPEAVQAFSAHLVAHVLAPEARLFVAPQLFSIDQLPSSHAKTAELTRDLAQMLINGKAYRPLEGEQETLPFLADTRYLLAAVAVPEGQPLFCWQVGQNPIAAAELRTAARKTWQEQSGPDFARLLPGCHVDLLLPSVFFSACRKADVEIRPGMIHAAVHFLTQTLAIEASDLRAVVAPFGELSSHTPISEYRIGFAKRHGRDLLYGIVWPLYEQEDADEDSSLPTLGAPSVTASQKSPLEEIMLMLKEQGVICDCIHQERFPMEYCDDCGVPMFADHAGELVHAEMPEDVSLEVTRLH